MYTQWLKTLFRDTDNQINDMCFKDPTKDNYSFICYANSAEFLMLKFLLNLDFFN